MEQYRVEIGQKVPPEVWRMARGHLAVVFSSIAEMLEKANFEGEGKQDKEDFSFHAALALSAMSYVADCAADKVRFLCVPLNRENRGGGT